MVSTVAKGRPLALQLRFLAEGILQRVTEIGLDLNKVDTVMWTALSMTSYKGKK